MRDNNYLGNVSQHTMNNGNSYLGNIGNHQINPTRQNAYLGNAEKSMQNVTDSFLGTVGAPKSTGDTQGMEYMPGQDLSGLSKEQLQQLRGILVPQTTVEEELTHNNGYGM